MFLTKIELKKKDLFNDIYAIHKMVMSGFGSNPERILFRSENNYIIIQSVEYPKYILSNFNRVITKTYNFCYEKGNILNFKIIANVTKSISRKRFAILDEQEQIKWLIRKSKDNGFKICFVMTSKSDKVISDKKGQKQIHNKVIFEGELVVTNKEKFEDVLKKGIGPAKGYGFGLLSVLKKND